jgi:hypothetical protein
MSRHGIAQQGTTPGAGCGRPHMPLLTNAQRSAPGTAGHSGLPAPLVWCSSCAGWRHLPSSGRKSPTQTQQRWPARATAGGQPPPPGPRPSPHPPCGQAQRQAEWQCVSRCGRPGWGASFENARHVVPRPGQAGRQAGRHLGRQAGRQHTCTTLAVAGPKLPSSVTACVFHRLHW